MVEFSLHICSLCKLNLFLFLNYLFREKVSQKQNENDLQFLRSLICKFQKYK